jgi:hypothetical protein
VARARRSWSHSWIRAHDSPCMIVTLTKVTAMSGSHRIASRAKRMKQGGPRWCENCPHGRLATAKRRDRAEVGAGITLPSISRHRHSASTLDAHPLVNRTEAREAIQCTPANARPMAEQACDVTHCPSSAAQRLDSFVSQIMRRLPAVPARRGPHQRDISTWNWKRKEQGTGRACVRKAPDGVCAILGGTGTHYRARRADGRP